MGDDQKRVAIIGSGLAHEAVIREVVDMLFEGLITRGGTT